jgi:hypothetical protein
MGMPNTSMEEYAAETRTEAAKETENAEETKDNTQEEK